MRAVAVRVPGLLHLECAAAFAAALSLAISNMPAAASPVSPSESQTAAPAKTRTAAPAGAFSAQAVREDLHYLYDTLAAGHYDLFAYRERADYDALFERLLASVHGPQSRREAAALFQQLAAYGRVGHARTDAPLTEFVAHLGRGGTLLPIFIRVDGEKVHLTRTADLDGELAAGTRLLAIDNRPIGEWLEKLGRLVSAERPYMAQAQMEESFPALLWAVLGEREGVSVTVRGPDGEPVEAHVPAVTRSGLRAIAGRHPTPEIQADFSAREVELLPGGIAYLRPGPFMNIEGDEAGPPSYDDTAFRQFLDDALGRILAAGSSDLVIDLRNNPGGNNNFSDAMVAWFADRPFRFASSFMLKASAPTKAWYQRLRSEGAPIDEMLARLMEAEANQPNGTRYPFEIPLVAPRAGARFDGRVWVLVNRHSYSNAASVAALIQDYGFGTILGEETADVPTTYASAVHFELPNSGYSVAYPKSYFIRPDGDEAVRGVIPDVKLARQPIGVETDVMLDAALAHIRVQR